MNILALASLIGKTNAAASSIGMLLSAINDARNAHADRDQLPEVLTVADLAPDFEAKREALLQRNREWLDAHR